MSYTLSPIEVYINSNDYDYSLNGTDNSSLVFYLKNPIKRPNGYFLKLKLANLSLPISYYLIDSTNNTLIVNSTTYYVTSGNYNTSTLTSALNNLLSGIVVSFSSITNKFTFTGSSSFTFGSSSGLLSILGFSGSSLTSSSNVLVSDAVVDLSGKNNTIYFDVANINTFNISSNTGMRTSIIKSIVVDVQQGGVLLYENKTDACVYLQEDSISFLHIRLLGEDMETLLKLNNVNWNATLEVSFVRIPEPVISDSFVDYLNKLTIVPIK